MVRSPIFIKLLKNTDMKKLLLLILPVFLMTVLSQDAFGTKITIKVKGAGGIKVYENSDGSTSSVICPNKSDAHCATIVIDSAAPHSGDLAGELLLPDGRSLPIVISRGPKNQNPHTPGSRIQLQF